MLLIRIGSKITYAKNAVRIILFSGSEVIVQFSITFRAMFFTLSVLTVVRFP